MRGEKSQDTQLEMSPGTRSQLLTPCLEFVMAQEVCVHAADEPAHCMDETNEAKEVHSLPSQKEPRAADS